MPIPTTIEMNITEKMLRWPTVRVMTPMRPGDAHREHAQHQDGLAHAPEGQPHDAQGEDERRARWRPGCRWKAADISSLESTGPPVTPAWTCGNTARRRVDRVRGRPRSTSGRRVKLALVALGRLDQDEEQALVVGEEVAGVGLRRPRRTRRGCPTGSGRGWADRGRCSICSSSTCEEARVDGRLRRRARGRTGWTRRPAANCAFTPSRSRARLGIVRRSSP